MAKVSINFDRDFTQAEKEEVAKIAVHVMENMQNELRKTKLSDHKRVVAHYKILEFAKLAMERSMTIMGVERGK